MTDYDMQELGLCMDYLDACYHICQGRRVVRIGWGTYAPREHTEADKRATDWVVLPDVIARVKEGARKIGAVTRR